MTRLSEQELLDQERLRDIYENAVTILLNKLIPLIVFLDGRHARQLSAPIFQQIYDQLNPDKLIRVHIDEFVDDGEIIAFSCRVLLGHTGNQLAAGIISLADMCSLLDACQLGIELANEYHAVDEQQED